MAGMSSGATAARVKMSRTASAPAPPATAPEIIEVEMASTETTQ